MDPIACNGDLVSVSTHFTGILTNLTSTIIYRLLETLGTFFLWHRLVLFVICIQLCMTYEAPSIYSVTVQNFGSTAAESHTDWTLNAASVMAGLIEAVVQVHFNYFSKPIGILNRQLLLQGFFAYRIQVLSQRWFITILLWTGCLAVFATETVTVGVDAAALISQNQNHVWLVTATQLLLALVDCVNTVTLCTYLRIRRTGFSGYIFRMT